MNVSQPVFTDEATHDAAELNAATQLTLTMTKGLPASGKSTWSVEQIRRAEPGTLVRVSKDMLRAMLHDNGRSKTTERQVLAARDAIVESSLRSKVSVIVDDTNLLPYHTARLEQLADKHGARFVIQDFTDVDLETCLTRNEARTNKVPAAVIVEMHHRYLGGEDPRVDDRCEIATAKRDAIIVDLDGTLAIHTDRSPFEWGRVSEDIANHPVVTAVKAMARAGFDVVYCSGRDEICRPDTEAWIKRHVGISGPLFMRGRTDNRRDAVIKRELYEMYIAPAYDIIFVLDDRDQVVDLWRNELNLTCFQVAPGNF